MLAANSLALWSKGHAVEQAPCELLMDAPCGDLWSAGILVALVGLIEEQNWTGRSRMSAVFAGL